MELNKQKGVAPLYFQLYEITKKKIDKGIYKYGDILPSEKDFMKQYNVSRITVRQAFANLMQEGYLEGKRGVGTIVRYKKINEKIKSIVSFSQEMAQHGITMKTSYCEVKKIIANAKIALYIDCDEGDYCLRMNRVRCADDLPIVYSITYINKELELDIDNNYYVDSFYKYLLEKKNILVSKAQDTFEACIATKEIAKFLEIKEKSPVFVRTRKSYTFDNRLIEYSISYYPGEKYKYSMDL